MEKKKIPNVNLEESKKTIYQYDIKIQKSIQKPYSEKFLINPLFCAVVVNLSILMTLVAIGFYFGIFGSLNYKRLYGEHCAYDSDCETGLNLRCQNGNCNCTTSTFYNKTRLLCVPKQQNAVPCSTENDCCCDQKCLYDSAEEAKLCSCTTDRWWDQTNSVCQKKSYYSEACSTNGQCLLGTNLVCLSSKCDCSDANLNFWNGTYCDAVESYMGICRITKGCNPSQGLICNITEQYPYKCTCSPYNYWDSALSICRVQKTESQSCGSTDECKSDTGLYCDTVCKCDDNYFWSIDKCIKKKTYGEICSVLLECDITGLSCINSYCVCTGTNFWNGSYCVSPISNGLNCENSFGCNQNLGLSCDSITKQCICAPTHYWSQETCRLKEINGTWCTNSLQCQTENGLSCVTNRCFCAEYHYWSGTKCLLKQTVNTWCTNTYQCQDFNGLVCLLTGGRRACECQYPRYWNGLQCVNKLSFGESCSKDAECDQNYGLACYGQCRCDASKYWNNSNCITKNDKDSVCSQNFQCKDNLGLLCLSGICNCMPLMYWSNNKCEFKLEENQACGVTSTACQDYAGLSCTSGTCRVGINQYCDGTTYRCKSGLTCQGSTAGNFICQCAPGTYWNGASCQLLISYGSSCDSWRLPCDYSQKLKCLSDGEGTSCLTGYTGTMCTCIDTDYWSGTACVPKLLDAVNSDNGCKCRHDLGLQRLPYVSPYTCYANNNPSQQCACPNDQYWGGEKCVSKKTYFDYCTISCQCRENLLLSCQQYTNGYSCYNNFGTGMKCLCNHITHWWNSATSICVAKYTYSTTCDNSCKCREDKGLSCKAYNGYSCLNNDGISKCDCGNTQFWLGTTCVSKRLNGAVCSRSCECRIDLGLYCNGSNCRCHASTSWNGSACV
ncbi:multiple epidermal growth factor-like domains 10 isoform X1 [Brachionus plicatilis]|uniref:Multiple epidermal growth factor-like domains 10 isoform X1 n=1 Tax=Brachionus plicatilis TaxID=10195 RepID=A0A3M7SAJ2_BRAPC|nr:multiple epidermal growth factor-like domains 10 isoform X1 [Brachionus plicatilis]